MQRTWWQGSKQLFSWLLLLLLTSHRAIAYEPNQIYRYSVVHFGDIHGHFMPDQFGQGGYAAIKTVIDNIRKQQKSPVILLNSGDYNLGTLASEILQGRADIFAMNMMDIDAIVAGNHEFDIPLESLVSQKEDLNAPLISANVKYKNEDGTLSEFFRPYVIIQRGGLTFLVVGLTPQSTIYQSNPNTTKHFAFLDPFKSLEKAIADAKQITPIDVVIVLDHLGFNPLGDIAKGKNYGSFNLAQMINTGEVSLIVTANSRNFGCVNGYGQAIDYRPGMTCTVPYANKIPIVSANINGLYVGKADFEFKNGVSKLVKYQLYPVNVKNVGQDGKITDAAPPVTPDPALDKVLKNYYNHALSGLNKPVGTIDRTLMVSRFKESIFGTIVAKALALETNADFAIVNSGSVDNNIPRGTVTTLMIREAIRYNNYLVTVKLTGAQVASYLQKIYAMVDGGKPNYYGITFKVNRSQKRIWDIRIKSKPIDDEKVYTLTINKFLALGGDSYPVVLNSAKYNAQVLDLRDSQAFENYLRKQKHLVIDNIPLEGPEWIVDKKK
ncbi:bifunctional metallophosphatase/5'-nucleotidase [Psittacicella hinzii]|nr:5'-nucleotidase C-terminal domain-containing protein [Psittacicella hinzii]